MAAEYVKIQLQIFGKTDFHYAYKKFYLEIKEFFETQHKRCTKNRQDVSLIFYKVAETNNGNTLMNAYELVGISKEDRHNWSSEAYKMREGKEVGPQSYTVLYFWLHCHKEYSHIAKEIDQKILGNRLNILDFFPKPRRLTGEAKYTLDLVRSYATSILERYQNSELRSLFDIFREREKGGVWLLTAGAGYGKTTIMAKIIEDHLEKYPERTIPYFFTQPLQKTIERKFDALGNRASEFYEFVCDCLHSYFPDISSTLPDRTHFNGDILGKVLLNLSDLKLISPNEPLFIFIDGLDELQISDKLDHGENNPLGLPNKLPDGVYIGCSIRLSSKCQNDVEDLITDKKLPSYHDHVHMEWGRFGEMHKSAMRQFVKSICVEGGHVKHYNELRIEFAREEFINTACENAGYNGVILRCLFFEETFWNSTSGNLGDINSDIENYYIGYWRRLLDYFDDALPLNPILCLSFDTKISEVNFLRTAHFNGHSDQLQAVNLLLRQLIRQGLVIKQMHAGSTWLSPYHFTFKEFLNDKSKATPHNQLITHSLRNLRSHVGFDDLENPDAIDPIEIQKEWIIFWLRFCLTLENTQAYEECILDQRVWNFFDLYDNSIIRIIGKVAVIEPSLHNTVKFKSILQELAEKLGQWTRDGSLIYSYEKRPYRFDELITLADESGGYPIGRDQELYLIDFLNIVGQSPVNTPAQRELNALSYQVSTCRHLRIQWSFDQLKGLLDDLKPAISQIDQTKYAVICCRYYYEIGYAAYLKGDVDESNSAFQMCYEVANAGGSKARAWIARYVQELNTYLANRTEPKDYFVLLTELKAQYDEISDINPMDIGYWEFFGFNLAHRIAVTALECDYSVEFNNWTETTLNHSIMADRLAENSPAYLLMSLQMRCQRALMNGKNKSALYWFLAYMGNMKYENIGTIKELIPMELRSEESQIHLEYPIKREQFAKDFRDFARLVLKLNIPKKIEIAKTLYELGLLESSQGGNTRYIKDINAELARIPNR